MNESTAQAVLEEFLSYPLTDSRAILDRFASLHGAIARFGGEKRNFVYVPGARDDRVLLVAHADTVWDEYYLDQPDLPQTVRYSDGVYSAVEKGYGIGADDRAGCAMLWLLKDSGHSLLVLDGEEHGQIGANYIKSAYPSLHKELNAHAYMVQLDRRGKSDYKVYELPVPKEFKRFIEEKTNFSEPDKSSRTDIVALCTEVCGVNLSIGYYHEHTPKECLVFREWYRTLTLVEDMLLGEQRRFPLK
ncbi:MAG: hypothetical protein IJ735_03385 [Clostridia bacterium]|nr:hypothetical protein [Clostridia bacterium]